jgi:hypothetical protein
MGRGAPVCGEKFHTLPPTPLPALLGGRRQQCRSTATIPHPHLPYMWGDGRSARLAVGQLHLPSLCLPASPTSWVDGAVTQPGGDKQSQHPENPSLFSAAPLLGGIVREGACASVGECACPTPQPANNLAKFFALYERCTAREINACISMSHAAGCHDIIIVCRFLAPVPVQIKKRCRHCC